jgi:crossover junction endodeoxyribonuclease RusA
MNPMADGIALQLPYPPSVNRYWRRAGTHMHISTAGRKYRQAICDLLGGRLAAPLAGPLRLEAHAYPPDRRRRDVDNIAKALLDALQHAGIYEDDSQIYRLTIERRTVVIPGGRICARIWTDNPVTP